MRIDGWMEDSAWRKSLACGWDARWPTITPSAGMEITGACHAKKSARVFGVRRWKSSDDWIARSRYAFAAAISACAIAQPTCARPQVLPAYGLRDSRNEEQNQKIKSNPNIMCLPITPGGNHGPGHFYLAKNRTFLLCVDITLGALLLSHSSRPKAARRVQEPTLKSKVEHPPLLLDLRYWAGWQLPRSR